METNTANAFNDLLKEIQGLNEAHRLDLGKEFKLSPKQCSSVEFYFLFLESLSAIVIHNLFFHFI